MTARRPPRVLAYSFDGMGLGHLRRNLTLLGALAERVPQLAVLTVTGSGAIERFPLPAGVDVLRLPGLAKTTLGSTRAARLPLPATEVRAIRSALLTAAVRSFRPDLILVDFYPLGREGELANALDAARQVQPEVRLVLGLRDILDAPATVAAEWRDTGQFTAAAALYDTVMVYGDASVYDSRAEYDFPPALADKTVFTGYLADAATGPPPPRRGGAPDIVCTMGGGSDAAGLAAVFVEAVTPMVREGRRALLLTGPFMPGEDVARLQAAAPAGLEIRTFVPDAPAWFAAASCVVSMAGYNTTCELLAAGVPTVFVPRARPRLEQRLRAVHLAALTGWHVLLPEDLQPAALRALMADALTLPRGGRVPLRLDGAKEAARVLHSALADATRPASVAL